MNRRRARSGPSRNPSPVPASRAVAAGEPARPSGVGVRIVSSLGVVGALAALSSGCAPPSEEGTFVVRLGSDTTAVEHYRLTDHRMEILAVTRSPRTLHREAVLEVSEDGNVSRFESQVLDPAAGGEVVERTVIRYDGDEAEIETTGREGRTETSRVEAGPDVIPFSPNHFSLKELALRRALAAERTSFRLLSDGTMSVRLDRPASDSVVFDVGQLGTWRARVDEDGRFLELHAGALGRDVERVPDLDVEGLARRFHDEDARGYGMGPLSPRDTVRAEVHEAELVIDYGRPAARGREIFGGLVPWGEVWRTGADQATHLSTDRALLLDGERLPAGRYSIFTIPDPDGWILIVNERTGQAGTDYDPGSDLLRIPLEVEHLSEAVERFTISVEEEEEGGVLRFLWTGTGARIPFQVESGAE